TNFSFVRNDYIADTLRNYSDPSARKNDERFLIADFEELDKDAEFETGEAAEATSNFDNKSSGEASAQLIIHRETDIDEQYVSLFAPENKVFNMETQGDAFPK